MDLRFSAGPAFQWRMDNGVVFGAKTEAGIIKAGNSLKPTAAIGLQFGYGFEVF